MATCKCDIGPVILSSGRRSRPGNGYMPGEKKKETRGTVPWSTKFIELSDLGVRGIMGRTHGRQVTRMLCEAALCRELERLEKIENDQ